MRIDGRDILDTPLHQRIATQAYTTAKALVLCAYDAWDRNDKLASDLACAANNGAWRDIIDCTEEWHPA